MPPRARGRSAPRSRSSNRNRNVDSSTPPANIFPPLREQSPSPEIFPATPDVSDDDDVDGITLPLGQTGSGAAPQRERSPPPVLISPIKRRQRAAAPTINKQDDISVWSLTDEEIIGV